ncbi:hypothetical protein [Streptomyces sp. NPDC051776]|uniref:hypothetical protein n=1 Tax=Streptomyces sp. NPDC051776 TaxID=3155414 RepID=UPI00343AD29C
MLLTLWWLSVLVALGSSGGMRGRAQRAAQADQAAGAMRQVLLSNGLYVRRRAVDDYCRLAAQRHVGARRAALSAHLLYDRRLRDWAAGGVLLAPSRPR